MRVFTNALGRRGLLFCLAISIASSVSCSGNPASPSGNASLRLMLTDDIADVDEVNIYFTSVTAKPVDQPPQQLTLELQTNPVNLLTLANTVTTFAAGAVEPGTYEFIRVNIDQSKSNLVENGVKKSLKVPSQEVKIIGPFAVDANHATTLTLDFDAGASLVKQGNGDWLLKPVIIVTDRKTSEQS